MNKTTLDRLEVCAKKGAHVSREEFLELIALARRSLPVDAAGIKTWRERLLPGYEECDEREARDAEVAELRAALARAGSAAPAGQLDLSASGLLKLWERANAEATNTMPAPFVFARLLLAAPTAAEGPSDPVVEANRALLLERSRVGISKYGVTLAASGLSRAQLAQHALEEALDLANYLQTIIQTDAAIAAQPKDTTDTKEKA